MSKKAVVTEKATKRQHFLEAKMNVMVGKYHLFKKTRQGNTYFYYWYQQGNERIFKACGRACTEKREAVAFFEQLLKEELTASK